MPLTSPLDVAILPGEDGIPIPVVGGLRLLSPYGTKRQINRFVDSVPATARQILVFVFPPLLSLPQAFQEQQKGRDWLSILPEEFAPFCKPVQSGTVLYDPALDEIDTLVTEQNFLHINIVEWHPSRKAFGSRYDAVVQHLQHHLALLKSSLMTKWFFERRWFRNILVNAANNHGPVSFVSQGVMVLAASGPSLAAHVNQIRQARKHIVLAALPSSLSFLDYHNLEPDLIFTSDGGYHADMHLRRYLLHKLMAGTPFSGFIVAPDRANLAVCHRLGIPLQLFCLDNERTADPALSRTASYPDRGSVAFTALDILSACHAGPVVAAGLDLSNHEHASHVIPHTFDAEPFLQSGRLNPARSTELLNRYGHKTAGPWWGNPALEAYRQWLLNHAKFYPSAVELCQPAGSRYARPPFFPVINDLPRMDSTLSQQQHNSATPPAILEDWIAGLEDQVTAFPASADNPDLNRVFSRECYKSAQQPESDMPQEKRHMLQFMQRVRRELGLA